MGHRSSHVLKSYAKILFGSAAGRALSFLNIILCSKLISVTEFGLYTICVAVLNVTWQVSQCFDISYIKFAKSEVGATGKDAILGSNIQLKKYFILFVCGISYPLAYLYGNFYLDSSTVVLSLFLSACAGAFLVYSRTLAAVYQEKEHFGLYTVIGFIHPFLVFVGIGALYALGDDVRLLDVVFIYFIGAIVSMIASLYYLNTRIRISKSSKNTSSLRKVLDLSKWVFLVTLLYYIFQRVDVLVIGRIVGLEELGLYSAASQIALIFSLFTGSVSGIFLPKSMLAVQSGENFRAYLKEAFIPVVFIVFAFMVFFAISPLFVTMAFGEIYRGSILVIRILTIGWCFQTAYLPFQYLFYALNKPQIRFVLEAVKLGIASLLLIVLTPRYGVEGAAAAISLAFLINLIFAGAVSLSTVKSRLITQEI